MLAIAAWSLATLPAQAAEVTIGSRTVDLPVPRDHCVLTETGPRDGVFIKFVESLQSSHHRVLLITVNCQQLREFREDHGWYWKVSEFAAYVTPRLTNQSWYIGMTRADYAAESAQKMAREILPERTNEIERWSSQLKRNAGFRAAIEERDVLEHDASAMYMATVSKASDGNGVKRYYAVSASTLFDGQPITFSTYRYSGDKGRPAALRQAKATVSALLDVEKRLLASVAESPGASSPLPGWSPTVLAVGIGGALGALTLALGALLLRARE
jgi:hypothetical protein